jgi:hypothetical protein
MACSVEGSTDCHEAIMASESVIVDPFFSLFPTEKKDRKRKSCPPISARYVSHDPVDESLSCTSVGGRTTRIYSFIRFKFRPLANIS